MKVHKLHTQFEGNKAEQAKFFEISAKRNENYMDLSNQFHKHELEITELLNKFKTATNN